MSFGAGVKEEVLMPGSHDHARVEVMMKAFRMTALTNDLSRNEQFSALAGLFAEIINPAKVDECMRVFRYMVDGNITQTAIAESSAAVKQ